MACEYVSKVIATVAWPRRFAAEFQGVKAFNFSHELELSAQLMQWVREEHAVTDEVQQTPPSKSNAVAGELPRGPPLTRTLEAVSASNVLKRPMLYFLEWVDHRLVDTQGGGNTYREIQSKLEKWCNDAPNQRRAFVISRNRVGFAYPRGGRAS
ncbi:MAG: hypothetical protein ACE5JL_03640 [Dehalococcoidia bacterium]